MLPDLYSKLANDATLAELLGGSATDTHIHPDRAADDKAAPYVVYGVNSAGDSDELLDAEVVDINIYSASATLNLNIHERIKSLLDLQDQVNIPSTDYRIFYCKHVGGSTQYEPEARLYHRVASYAIKYVKQGD